MLKEEPGLPERVRTVASTLAAGLRDAGLAVTSPAAAVISVRAPSPELAVRWAEDWTEEAGGIA